MVSYKRIMKGNQKVPFDDADLVFKALADASRRELLDRLHGRAGQTLGVQPDLLHIGDYKTAVNTFTEKTFTPAHREMTESLNRDTFEQLVQGIATARKKTPDEVRALIDQGPFNPEDALSAGLVVEPEQLMSGYGVDVAWRFLKGVVAWLLMLASAWVADWLASKLGGPALQHLIVAMAIVTLIWLPIALPMLRTLRERRFGLGARSGHVDQLTSGVGNSTDSTIILIVVGLRQLAERDPQVEDAIAPGDPQGGDLAHPGDARDP